VVSASSAEQKTASTGTALLLAIAGFGLLTFGDAVIKSINGAMTGTAVSLVRYVFGAVFMAALLFWREGRAGFTVPRPWIQLGRAASVGIGSTCFFTAVFLMPMTEATVITFVTPMLVALFSSFFLKEHAPRAAWIAIAVAFAGVLIVLRPEVAKIGWAGLLPIGTAVCMAIMIVLNRMASGHGSVVQMQFLIAALAVPILAAVTLIGHFSGIPLFHVTWPGVGPIIKCALVGCSASLAHGLVFMATERASAAVIAPATYVQLLVAMSVGYFAFGDVPDAAALAGAALIIGAGVYLWWNSK
jgi:drug/metabolite transporter (DMT)-like permease